MLQQTFAHIPGITVGKERKIWSSGIHSWDDAECFEKRFGAADAQLQQKLDDYIPRSREAVESGDAAFFTRLGDIGEGWRVFREFRNRCVYLDIETTGLSTVFDSVTVVGLYDGTTYTALVGRDIESLQRRLRDYAVIVTFNGSGFDLRFLRSTMPNLELPPIHIDLRWLGRRLGAVGGLKKIESDIGIERDGAAAQIDGFEATVLWSRYLAGERAALDSLIEYNAADVVNLKSVMEIFYDRLRTVSGPAAAPGERPTYVGCPSVPRRAATTRARATLRPQRRVVRQLLSSAGAARRVVGIDLTGSERRATGWCMLDGAKATTRTIVTDLEIIEATLESRPDLVSIDSPLTLPENCRGGSINRAKPIYRRCELALKRMGISVFWCLLPSMQGLTLRGMALAAALRARGLEVIESYPGAAQDILGIPRKGASLAELKTGLARAGIEGAWQTEQVTHDEVDAVTSALVGLFYLAGDHIALGNAPEGYLIVPRSPRINHRKLSEVAAATGLDPIPDRTA